ncbi:MAG: hypothetical protein RJA81_1327 [Planctomycetota bacterium]|jgi:hypothetical protein
MPVLSRRPIVPDLFEKLPRLDPNPKDDNLDRHLADRWLKGHPELVWEIQQNRQSERTLK